MFCCCSLATLASMRSVVEPRALLIISESTAVLLQVALALHARS